MKKLFVLFSLIFCFSFCSADLGWYTIGNYTADFELLENWELNAHEKIEVYFNESRHGIYRDLPYKLASWWITPIYNVSVLDPYKVMFYDQVYRIQIGEQAKYVRWWHAYDIKYTVGNSVRSFSWWDELYWNVLWVWWNTDINWFNFSVKLPESVKLNKDDYYAVKWAYWNTWFVDLQLKGNVISNKSPITLWRYEGVTLAIRFPNWVIKNSGFWLYKYYWYVKSRILSFYYGVDWREKGMTFWIIFVVISYLIWGFKFVLHPFSRRKWKRIRDIIYYDPPKEVSPAEIALIYNWDNLWKSDVLAVLLYTWIAEGVIEMKQDKLKWDYLFNVIKQKDTFFRGDFDYKIDLSLEERAWNFLFRNRAARLLWSDRMKAISKGFYDEIEERQEHLKKTLIWREPSDYSMTVWVPFLLIGLLFMFLPLVAFLLPVIYILWYLVLQFMVSLNLDEKHLTEKWKDVMEKIMWFRKYLLAVENDKLNFLIKQDPHYCEKILPYAIALWIGDKRVAKCNQYQDLYNVEVLKATETSWLSLDNDSFSTFTRSLSAWFGDSSFGLMKPTRYLGWWWSWFSWGWWWGWGWFSWGWGGWWWWGSW